MPTAETPFRESSEPTPRGRDEMGLLERKISELELRIEGTALERLVEQLHRELRARGLSFMPRCYLSDEWGCPDGVPVIGIPFYLAHPKLARIEEEEAGDIEGDQQIMMYLRHEAGHAYNYAYQLYETEEWHVTFGPYTRPYVDDYKPAPFSKKFVRHIPGWYAQKHPDEDFAETFAVWLTPDINWEQAYKGWPALQKLQYVDKVMRALPAEAPNPGPARATDDMLPVEKMDYTVREHYARQGKADVAAELGMLLDGDLRDLFGAPGAEGEPAGRFIVQRRRDLVRDVAYWTGERPPVIGALVDHLAERATKMELTVPRGRESVLHVRFSIMLTTLVVNHLYRDRFVDL
ncbi:MAG: hypothetical protein AB2A00_11590 [Myxococcota bacterium]